MSLAMAEQLRSVSVMTPVSGVMLASAVKTGSVFSTVTATELDAVPPLLSVAVAVQVTVSDGDTIEGVRSNCMALPTTLPLTVHS